MAQNAGERTEKPTPRRLREARRKGQIARSRDLGSAVSLAAVLVALGWLGRPMMDGLAAAVAQHLGRLGTAAVRDMGPADLNIIVFGGLRTMGLLVGPMAGVAALGVIAGHTLQGGWNFATEALQLQWSRLSPANGLKRLGFSAGGVESGKMVVVVAALSSIGVMVVLANLRGSLQLARLTPMQAAEAGWADAERLLRQSALALLAIAAADYGLQRWRLSQSLRMTKQEVRDDMRLTEGAPEIKARVRRIQLSMSRRRMITAVPRATLVVTNPTHYAVALEYRRGEMAAPRVVAKGRGLMAARIKAVARHHGVPTVENVPLAQALYKSVDVGATIPAVLFDAVAEVLAYLIRLKQLVL
jgi:flagellar biosynthetic protein FlhB